MSAFKDKLRAMVKTIKEGAVDFSSLEVTTMTGEISHFINEKGKFDITKINGAISGTVETTARIEVIAHTHMAFDQDCLLFVKENMTPEEKELFHLHIEMLSAARVSRMAFLQMIRAVVD